MGLFSAGSQKTTSTQKMPKWQEAAVKQNLSGAMSSQDINYTDRNLTAGNNPAMYSGLSGVQGLNTGISGQQYGNYMTQGLDALANPQGPRFDQAGADAVMANQNLQPGMNALQAGFDRSLAQGLTRAGYGAGGFTGNFGSAGALAKGGAIGASQGEYLNGIASLYGNAQDRALQAGIGYGSENAQLRQAAASGLLNGAMNGIGTSADLFGQQFTMGNQMTGLDQAGIDREVGRDMFNANAGRDSLMFRQNFAGRMGDYGGTTTQKSPTASPFQQALGTATSLAGAYMTGGGSLLAGGMGGGMGSMFGFGGGGGGVGGLVSGVSDSRMRGFGGLA